MKTVFLAVVSVGLVSTSQAQTMCLGINCDSEIDQHMPGGAYDRHLYSYDNVLLGLLLDDEEDPDREQCIRKCHSEFKSRINDCDVVYGSDVSTLRDAAYLTCLEWANRKHLECLSPGSLMKCN